MTMPNGPGGREGLRAVTGMQWTDNVARVYAVVKRHPEVSVEWPRVTGRPDFKASWPLDPENPESDIESVQTMELGVLAARLEKEFPA